MGLKSQALAWVLPPLSQQHLQLPEHLGTMGPLVFVALEAVEEDDKFRVAATPESGAPAVGTSLGRESDNLVFSDLSAWPEWAAGQLE